MTDISLIYIFVWALIKKGNQKSQQNLLYNFIIILITNCVRYQKSSFYYVCWFVIFLLALTP